MAGVQRKGGKKNRKWGRNEAKCATYKAQNRLRKRKVANLVRVNKLPAPIATKVWEDGEATPRATRYGVETKTSARYEARAQARNA